MTEMAADLDKTRLSATLIKGEAWVCGFTGPANRLPKQFELARLEISDESLSPVDPNNGGRDPVDFDKGASNLVA
jgi:hypothetical protein